MASSITVRTPASIANLGPGFDVFGLAVNAFYDEVTLRKTKSGITIISNGSVPSNPHSNTAGIVVGNMKRRFKINGGIEIAIRKMIPPGFGMGSSAASAAAAAVAFDRLFRLGLDSTALVEFAGVGEKASAGTVHYDNVAAAVCGGFTIVRTDPLDVIMLDPPADLRICIAVPKLDVPKKKTRKSRKLIPKQVRFSDHIANLSNASAMVAGFAQKDSDLIGSSIHDIIVEPARMRMIPGFSKVKDYALKAGATGVTISGAGPSVVAFSKKSADLEKISTAMAKGFATAGTKCMTIVCKPTKGADIRNKAKAIL
ncbi:MAG: homoserine kinase [Nitrosopumilus sp. D6]|nr:MAG: homoserine kinase [Nitrosopumilus sp. D6]